MTGTTKKFIKIDLSAFKLHLSCSPEIDITLYFNTPSRKFYLAVIALLVNEMKKKGTIKPIPLQKHLNELKLLNKTIGKEAGSSKKELLLHRIYKKWKDALPDLGKAPLFQIIGRKKRYDESMEKVYIFTEAEKDCWANLFEYMGSHENVRLKFALNRLSLSLEDVEIIYGNSSELPGDGWGRFIKHLSQNLEARSEAESVNGLNAISDPSPAPEDLNRSALDLRKQIVKFAITGLVIILVGFLFWQYNKPVSNIEVASIEEMALPLPENPSIAVLAFDNMTGDPGQDYFCDGIADEIITALSRIHQLFIVARNSSFFYKGKSVKIKQISEELGVRYVLEGSVRLSDDRVRITAQLIDALEGRHVWAKNYDHDFENTLKIHDDISLNIAQNLRIKLTDGEQARVFIGRYHNPEVFYKHEEAYSNFLKGTREGIEKYGRLAQEIIDLEPETEIGYRLLGWYHKFLFDRGVSRKENLKKAYGYAQKALLLNKKDPHTHSLLCQLYLRTKEYDKSIASGRRAIELLPNGSQAHMLLGNSLCYAGHFDEALVHSKMAVRLDPFPDYNTLLVLGRCYFAKEQYKNALAVLKRGEQRAPDSPQIQYYLAITNTMLGRKKEARVAAVKTVEQFPGMSVSFVTKTWRFKTKDRLGIILDAMRKAGFPE